MSSRLRSLATASRASVLLALVLTTATAQAQTFYALQDLPGGTFRSQVFGISADFSTVVGRSISASGEEAFRWTAATGMVGLGALPGGATFSSVANGVSADGSVIVGTTSSAQGTQAFRWTSATGMVGLGDLPGGAFASDARSVSADGTVVVGFSQNVTPIAQGQPVTEGFRWTEATGMASIGSLTGGKYGSTALSVSADGSVIAGTANDANFKNVPIRWTAATGMTSLGILPGYITASGNEISANGQVVIGTALNGSILPNDGFQAFRWSQATGLVGLGFVDPAVRRSDTGGTSADGNIIVGSDFIWTPTGGMKDMKTFLVNNYGFDLSSWSQMGLSTSITPDGLGITGTGVRTNGQLEGWFADLRPSTAAAAPEPASGLLLMAAFLTGVPALKKRTRRDW